MKKSNFIFLLNDVVLVVFHLMDVILAFHIDHIDHHEYKDNNVQFLMLHNNHLFQHMDIKIEEESSENILLLLVLQQIWTDHDIYLHSLLILKEICKIIWFSITITILPSLASLVKGSELLLTREFVVVGSMKETGNCGFGRI